MSDPNARPTTPAGWYSESGRQRWWDGSQWTDQYLPAKIAPRWRAPIWLLVVVGASALVLGVALGNASRGSSSQVDSLTQEIAQLRAENEALSAPVSAPPDSPEEASEPAATQASFPGSGTFLVGSDIEPGTYRSVDNDSCYWERLSGLTGSFDDIIANDNVEGQALVKIKASDEAFSSSRCNEWVKVE